MKISVIIPTLNEEFHIEKTLQSVIKQEGDYELYVVDGGSTDNSIAMWMVEVLIIQLPLPEGTPV